MKERGNSDNSQVYRPNYGNGDTTSPTSSETSLNPQKRAKIKVPIRFFDSTSTGNPGIELLTVDAVAALFQISKAGVRRLQHKRQTPFVKVGGSVRFLKSDIQSYLAKNRVEPIG